jgi:hypothetical protein
MKFSVIIVNYHSWPLTLACVASLLATGREDVEVFVVDNDAEAVPDLPAGVRLVRSGENLGLTKAWNRAIPKTAGELVVLLNPDTVVERISSGGWRPSSRASLGRGRGAEDPGRGRGATALGEAGDLAPQRPAGRTSLLTRLFPKSPLVRNQFPPSKISPGPRRWTGSRGPAWS